MIASFDGVGLILLYIFKDKHYKFDRIAPKYGCAYVLKIKTRIGSNLDRPGTLYVLRGNSWYEPPKHGDHKPMRSVASVLWFDLFYLATKKNIEVKFNAFSKVARKT